jgi:hypothetical protein
MNRQENEQSLGYIPDSEGEITGTRRRKARHRCTQPPLPETQVQGVWHPAAAENSNCQHNGLLEMRSERKRRYRGQRRSRPLARRFHDGGNRIFQRERGNLGAKIQRHRQREIFGQRLYQLRSNPRQLVPVHGPVTRQVHVAKGEENGLRPVRPVRRPPLLDSRRIHGLQRH